MKVIVTVLNLIPDGPLGWPQGHADGCADVSRGIKSGKYGSAETIDVEAAEDAALWIYDSHIRSGEMNEAGARCSTRYMPCLRKAVAS